ncbi:MAG TPA: transcription elongation factor GreA, partial [Polyangiaceae bacterium]|nr:transcription elongation factor GreA [Polyangiaceae bacterium]
MSAEKVPMTPQGSQKLRDELARLKEERPKVSREIGVAREHGDLSENAEYHAAKERQGMIEARIKDIEDKLSRAEVIDPSKLSGDRVKFGASVTLMNIDTEEELEYRIVGADEADLDQGTISVS